MNITVIGHLCLDVINQADGTETQSHGGIFFSVATLANLLGEKDTICPVFGVGKADYDPLMERLKRYPNVDPSGIFKFAGPTNQVSLHYHKPGEGPSSDGQDRTEYSRNIAEPIPLKRIRPYLEADMILINMISGFDITLDTMDEIRMDVRDKKTPVYFDIHSLTLGIKDDFSRFRRPLETWRRWMFWVHAVQMNSNEAAGMTHEVKDVHALAKQVLALNTNAMIVTLGERGYSTFVDQHKAILEFHGDAAPVKRAIDATGCGDVFGAAYCAHYLHTKDIAASAAYANRVAGMKAGMVGSADIDALSALNVASHLAGQAQAVRP